MTDAELQAIRERSASDKPTNHNRASDDYYLVNYREDVPALLAEVERLRGVATSAKGTLLQASAFLSSIPGDPAVQAAGLFKGPGIPRILGEIDAVIAIIELLFPPSPPPTSSPGQ